MLTPAEASARRATLKGMLASATQAALDAEDAAYKSELKAAGMKMASALRDKSTSREVLAQCKADFDALKEDGDHATSRGDYYISAIICRCGELFQKWYRTNWMLLAVLTICATQNLRYRFLLSILGFV